MSEPAKRAPAPPAIRRATDDDVLAMAQVHIDAWRDTYPGILPDAMLDRLSIATEAIRWQRMLDRPEAWAETAAFVADQEGTVVGYGTCGSQRTPLLGQRGFTGEVSEIYVLRSAQGQGVGTGLMRTMGQALLERGHGAMSLWVLAQNGPARRFYEGLGGVLIAEKRSNVPELAYGWADLRRLASAAAD